MRIGDTRQVERVRISDDTVGSERDRLRIDSRVVDMIGGEPIASYRTRRELSIGERAARRCIEIVDERGRRHGRVQVVAAIARVGTEWRDDERGRLGVGREADLSQIGRVVHRVARLNLVHVSEAVLNGAKGRGCACGKANTLR